MALTIQDAVPCKLCTGYAEIQNTVHVTQLHVSRLRCRRCRAVVPHNDPDDPRDGWFVYLHDAVVDWNTYNALPEPQP